MRIVRTLGSGASGVVQKAFLPRESRFVAVSAAQPRVADWRFFDCWREQQPVSGRHDAGLASRVRSVAVW